MLKLSSARAKGNDTQYVRYTTVCVGLVGLHAMVIVSLSLCVYLCVCVVYILQDSHTLFHSFYSCLEAASARRRATA